MKTKVKAILFQFAFWITGKVPRFRRRIWRKMEERVRKIRVYAETDIRNPILKEELWHLYTESFPAGYGGYIRDFTKEDFLTAMEDSRYLKIFAKRNGGVVAFVLASEENSAIIEEGYRDPSFLLKACGKEPDGRIFWIFGFCIKGMSFTEKNGLRNMYEGVAVGRFAINLAFDHGCIVLFDREDGDTPYLLRQVEKIMSWSGRPVRTGDISIQITSFISEA